jgi:hypothetical protein
LNRPQPVGRRRRAAQEANHRIRQICARAASGQKARRFIR